MSRFYGDLEGNRGQATRQGTKSSGINGHLRGWDIGAKVRVFTVNDVHDEVRVCLTSGSNSRKSDLIIFEANERKGLTFLATKKEIREWMKK